MLLDRSFLWVTRFLIGLSLLDTVNSKLTVKPLNTLVELGRDANLECCSDQNNSTLEWKFQKWNNGELFVKLCSGQTCHRDKYSIDSHRQGCSRLIANSSTAEVAGLYQCNELGTENVGGAYLVVYQFACGQNVSSRDELVEGITVVFNCTVLWKGKLPFQILSATHYGREIYQIFSQNQEFYSSSVSVDLLRPRLPSYIFSIQLLSTGITDENVDVQSPVANWSSTEEQVMHGASNIRTNCPKKDCEKPKGNKLECSADGFPRPTFQWLDWDLKTVSKTSTLQLKDSGSFEFICVARSTIGREEFEAKEKISVKVIEEIEEGMSHTTIMIIVILVILGLVVVAVGLIIFAIKPKFANVCHEGACKSPERRPKETKLIDKPPENLVKEERRDQGDNYLQQDSKDPKETARLWPVQVVDDEEIDDEEIDDEEIETQIDDCDAKSNRSTVT